LRDFRELLIGATELRTGNAFRFVDRFGYLDRGAVAFKPARTVFLDPFGRCRPLTVGQGALDPEVERVIADPSFSGCFVPITDLFAPGADLRRSPGVAGRGSAVPAMGMPFGEASLRFSTLQNSSIPAAFNVPKIGVG
jgi:hypothetical protein